MGADPEGLVGGPNITGPLIEGNRASAEMSHP